MSLFDDIAGTALGGVGGGLLAQYWGDLTKTPGAPGAPPIKKPMTAADVKLPGLGDLNNTFSQIGTNATDAVGSNYGGLKSRFAADARGPRPGGNLAPGSYGAGRFSTQQGLDQGNLEAALGGELGSTSYQDTLNQRGFGQSSDIANETAALNKPSLLQQIFQGIGGVGKTVGTYNGLKRPGGSSSPSSSPSAGGAYNIFNPGPLDLGYGGGY